MNSVRAVNFAQQVVDEATKGAEDSWVSRATEFNISPSSTGAAKAFSLVILELQGKLIGMSFRISDLDNSVLDFTVKLKKEAKFQDIFEYIKNAS